MKKKGAIGYKLLILIYSILLSTAAVSMTQREIGEVLFNATVKVNVYDGNNLVGHGSGVMLTREGLVGTNYHVIQMAIDRNYRILVESPSSGEKVEADVQNWNFFRDFAVLRMKKAGVRGFVPIRLGDSETVRPLDEIYVAGFPVTGIYKVQKGELNSVQTFGGTKAFDISVLIDHGNSGGPVVDSDGKLIGISVAYMKQARSMNLVIRVNDIKETIADAERGKRKEIVRDGRERETNNTREQANLLTGGMTIAGRLGPNDAVDWIEINKQEGYRPTFRLTHDAGCDFEFEIYSEKYLTGRAAGKRVSEGLTCNVPGRCFVKIMRKGGEGEYRFSVDPGRQRRDDGSEIEINDRREIANPISVPTITGSLDENDTVDWFVLAGQEGTRPTFTITHDANCNFDFEVYSDEAMVGRATGTASPDSIACSVPGRCFVKVWRVSGSGRYTLSINPRGVEDMEREPNNDRSSATLARSMLLRGGLSEGDAEDWFELDGQEGTRPTFTINHDANCNFDFEVYNGNDLVGRANGTGQSDRVTGFVPGRCFVRVLRVSGSGNYTIAITTNTPPPPSAYAMDGGEREPNNDRSSATMTRSLNLTGSLNEADTTDWFVLGGQEGTRPAITITHDAGANFDFEVFSDETLAGRATGTSSPDTITCDVPGRCYIRVWRVSGSGNYSIRIEPNRRQAAGPQYESGGREREPNNDRSSATPVGAVSITGTLDANDTDDWFVLAGQEGTRPTFAISHDQGANFDFEVFNNDALAGRATGTGPTDSITCEVPGRCTVHVWRVSGSGNYTLRINRSSAQPVPGPQTGGIGQEREPNDDRSTATRTGSMQFTGRLSRADSLDWFELEGQEGMFPEFIVSCDPNCTFDFKIFSGEALVGHAVSSGRPESVRCGIPGRCFVRIWRLQGEGAYTVRVQRSGAR